MFKREYLPYWLFLIVAVWSTRAVAMEVHLQVEEQNLLLSEPLAVNVSVSNTEAQPIQIFPLAAGGSHPNVVFYVITGTGIIQVKEPEFVLLQVESFESPIPMEIQAGGTISRRFLIGVDWAGQKPIFQNGANQLYCVVSNASAQAIESEKRSITVHEPQNQAETVLKSFLENEDNLKCLYTPSYLNYATQPTEIVTTVRGFAASSDTNLAALARQAILLWKEYERRAISGESRYYKQKGFDSLGLQDFQ
jgi:hypothetical protein